MCGAGPYLRARRRHRWPGTVKTRIRDGLIRLRDCLGVEVHGTRDVLLSRTPGLHQRGLAVAEVSVGGLRVAVASMHLGLRADERLRHVDEVTDALSVYEVPVVVAGDVNERPGEPAWSP